MAVSQCLKKGISEIGELSHDGDPIRKSKNCLLDDHEILLSFLFFDISHNCKSFSHISIFMKLRCQIFLCFSALAQRPIFFTLACLSLQLMSTEV